MTDSVTLIYIFSHLLFVCIPNKSREVLRQVFFESIAFSKFNGIGNQLFSYFFFEEKFA